MQSANSLCIPAPVAAGVSKGIFLLLNNDDEQHFFKMKGKRGSLSEAHVLLGR